MEYLPIEKIGPAPRIDLYKAGIGMLDNWNMIYFGYTPAKSLSGHTRDIDFNEKLVNLKSVGGKAELA